MLDLIPRSLPATENHSTKAFTRERKLSLPRLITFILSVTVSGKNQGIDTKSGQLFKQARRTGLWPEAEAVHRSAVTKARGKLPWEVLQSLFQQSVDLAYATWPERETDHWHGLSVFAIDGSKYSLPASQELRQVFDPESGLENSGKGHYPQCLVSTVYDVFRRLPVARTVVAIADGDERQQAQAMWAQIPSGGVLLHDRGYPSFAYIDELNQRYDGYYVFRCPAQSTFPAVERFVNNRQDEALIWIDPSNAFLDKKPKHARSGIRPIRLRAIRLESPDGTVSVLLTNLFDRHTFACTEIVALYFRRWAVEDHYRTEKIYLGVDTFHSKTANGVRQELFAVLIMSVITRILMVLSAPPTPSVEPQFKHAIMTLASDAALLAPEQPDIAVEIFQEVLTEIARVKYYQPKNPRPPRPRVSLRPINKWQQAKTRKLNLA